jgi:hypothetical protein
MHKVAESPIFIKGHALLRLFAFSRPEHTAITLWSLQNADLANKSELYVFLDDPRNNEDRQKLKETFSEIQKSSCFRKEAIKQRVNNIGLAITSKVFLTL